MASSSSLKLPKVHFKVDLVEASKRQLAFLTEVDQYKPHLYHGALVKNAIRRYEVMWLPLAASFSGKSRLVAPLDVHWIWHCHLLAPLAYEQDCLLLVNTVIDHALLSKSDSVSAQRRAKQLWEKLYTDEPFDVDMSAPHAVKSREYKSLISYPLEEAVVRQATFNYQVSLPHYRDTRFLKQGLDRYSKYLLLKNNYKEQPLVPCYDMDLIWHSHLLHPLAYKQDTSKVLGMFMNHDDSLDDRTEDSKLSKAHKKTKDLWTQIFNESFELPGAMYRGEPPAGKMRHPLTEEETGKFWQKKTKIFLYRFQSQNLHFETPVTLKVKLTNQKDASRRIITLNVTPDGQIGADDVTARFPFDSSADELLNFELVDKQGCLCLSSSTTLMTGNYHLLQEVENMQASSCDKGMSVTLVSSDSMEATPGGFVQVGFSVSMDPPVHGPCVLLLETGEYHSAEIPADLHQLWGPIGHAVLPRGMSNQCILARHR